MAKEIDRERRESERYGLRTKVMYEPSAGLDLKEKVHAGRTINISSGGFCLKTETPLSQSQIIRVSIPIPKVNAMSPTLAEVCWVEGLKKQKGYWVGLRFLL
ncbi:MAG: PilZ domain-containing protein [Candidatus Manganitrophus sp. SB1]|nr:PilZ domain-containing protein [Candidatus Manganitrophus morganii]